MFSQLFTVTSVLFWLGPGIVMAARSPAHQTVYMAEMKQCPGKDNLPTVAYNFTLDRGNRTQYYLNGDILMREAFPNGFKGE